MSQSKTLKMKEFSKWKKSEEWLNTVLILQILCLENPREKFLSGGRSQDRGSQVKEHQLKGADHYLEKTLLLQNLKIQNSLASPKAQLKI